MCIYTVDKRGAESVVLTGALFLPVHPKAALEAKYKEELNEAFGIEFNSLFTITNMPIKVSCL